MVLLFSPSSHRALPPLAFVAFVAFVALVALMTSGCAARERLQPGLANGPRLGGDAPVVSHDAVANASDSCPAYGTAGDPLPQRFPPCPRVGERAPSVALLSATVYKPHAPPPQLGRWKFHLE